MPVEPISHMFFIYGVKSRGAEQGSRDIWSNKAERPHKRPFALTDRVDAKLLAKLQVFHPPTVHGLLSHISILQAVLCK